MKTNARKGFTLVELIVVIAIMAVLAGTVAGVTISQLNKQTDKDNYEVQAMMLGKMLSRAVVSVEPYDIYVDGKLDASKLIAFSKSDEVGATDINWDSPSVAVPKKGYFSICVNQSGNKIFICYTGKQSSFGTKYVSVDDDGEFYAVSTMDLTT